MNDFTINIIECKNQIITLNKIVLLTRNANIGFHILGQESTPIFVKDLGPNAKRRFRCHSRYLNA